MTAGRAPAGRLRSAYRVTNAAMGVWTCTMSYSPASTMRRTAGAVPMRLPGERGLRLHVTSKRLSYASAICALAVAPLASASMRHPRERKCFAKGTRNAWSVMGTVVTKRAEFTMRHRALADGGAGRFGAGGALVHSLMWWLDSPHS